MSRNYTNKTENVPMRPKNFKGSSPYQILGPTVISMSGGRTSAMMLYKTLDLYGFKLPEDTFVTFANTGKEMPQTLDFVHRCQVEWGVPIVWLELGEYKQVGIWKSGRHKGKPRYVPTYKVVNYETASRNGEPFERLIRKRNYLPNPTARFCTSDLKVVPIHKFMNNQGYDYATKFIGFRADEPARASKKQGLEEDGFETHAPLYLDGIVKQDVYKFWDNHPFDLELPNRGGVNDWGNCDLCFLKGAGVKTGIIRERPDLVQWWKRMEEIVAGGGNFRSDQPGYAELEVIATSNMSFDFDDDETIPCFCNVD